MPNHRGFLGHRNQTLALAAATACIPLFTGDVRDAAVVAGVLTGQCVSPDMDLNAKVFGRLGTLGLVDEYAALVPHRHWISHSAILSTAIRFSLVFGPLLAIAWIIGVPAPSWAVWRFFVGLALADGLHIVADRTFTRVKKSYRKLLRPLSTQTRRRNTR